VALNLTTRCEMAVTLENVYTVINKIDRISANFKTKIRNSSGLLFTTHEEYIVRYRKTKAEHKSAPPPLSYEHEHARQQPQTPFVPMYIAPKMRVFIADITAVGLASANHQENLIIAELEVMKAKLERFAVRYLDNAEELSFDVKNIQRILRKNLICDVFLAKEVHSLLCLIGQINPEAFKVNDTNTKRRSLMEKPFKLTVDDVEPTCQNPLEGLKNLFRWR
jgi:hypothetical protein